MTTTSEGLRSLNKYNKTGLPHPLLEEAAAEIERLRVQAMICGEKFAEALDEIERLRMDFDRGAEGMRQAILQLLPGGQSCDPQWLADAIRAIGILRADEQSTGETK